MGERLIPIRTSPTIIAQCRVPGELSIEYRDKEALKMSLAGIWMLLVDTDSPTDPMRKTNHVFSAQDAQVFRQRMAYPCGPEQSPWWAIQWI